jgi:hypothetical protein
MLTKLESTGISRSPAYLVQVIWVHILLTLNEDGSIECAACAATMEQWEKDGPELAVRNGG